MHNCRYSVIKHYNTHNELNIHTKPMNYPDSVNTVRKIRITKFALILISTLYEYIINIYLDTVQSIEYYL